MMYFFKAAKQFAAIFTVMSAVAIMQVSTSTPAHAEKVPTIILIVDMAGLFTDSEVGQDVSRQVQELASTLQQEDLTTRQALAAEAESIGQQRANFSPEELQAKVNDIQLRQQTHVQKIAVRQQAIQRGRAQANSQIAEVIKPIFSELLQKHNAGLLIDQANVLAGGLDLNITSEAMALLNQRLTKVTVTPVSGETNGQ
ncbi:OmpH family outer membrane protein [Parvibaculaceae bacterium PLY_AMNH_Bact1]|nr:OmpH family outer membrane protein [Parvibaculaceae bacterium PLY_AMNH_Bact1]